MVSDDEIPERVILEDEDKKARTSASASASASASGAGEDRESDDPLDCIGQGSLPDKPKPKPPSEPPDPFARLPSPRLRPSMMARLPADGAHTRQLQKKQQQQQQQQRQATPVEIVDVDTLSDPIESATEWDREDEVRTRAEAEAEEAAAKAREAPRRSPTPSGRSNIRPGSVKARVLQLENKGAAKAPPKPSSSEAETPFIDLNSMPKPKSRKAGMKGKNQKVGRSAFTIWIALILRSRGFVPSATIGYRTIQPCFCGSRTP